LVRDMSKFIWTFQDQWSNDTNRMRVWDCRLKRKELEHMKDENFWCMGRFGKMIDTDTIYRILGIINQWKDLKENYYARVSRINDDYAGHVDLAQERFDNLSEAKEWVEDNLERIVYDKEMDDIEKMIRDVEKEE